jgi:parallel beta-helix repeat protein
LRTVIALIVCIALAAPMVGADPVPNKGIPNACESSPPGEPCKFVKTPPKVIPESYVVAGENRTYTGDWTHVGTLTIDGFVTFQTAKILEANTSGGIVVNAGGKLVLDTSTFTDAGSSPFTILAKPGSIVSLKSSAVVGGAGITIQTPSPIITGMTIQGIPGTALRLEGVSATMTGNTFRGNQLAVYQTGGVPRLVGNLFENNYECVHDFQTDPDIIGNTFAHCIIGIWHEQSHSTIKDNYMFEDAEPPSTGITVIDGNSPVIENNTITNFVNGIVIRNARAYVRNNTITDNVEAGILIDRNSMALDVTGNVVSRNGGDGIRLENASNIDLRRNTVTNNGGHGVLVKGAISGIVLDSITSSDNVGTGFRFESSNGIVGTRLTSLRNAFGVVLVASSGNLQGSNASENRASGFVIDSGSILVGSNLNCVRAIKNAQYGVLNYGGLDSATNGWYQGNVAAGVRTDELDSFVDARNSYWGSATGPRSPGNPTGTGDAAQGQVVFVPFAMAPPTATTCPVG